MFSETIFINHGSHELVRVNGHEAHNGHRELSAECESYSGSESGSVYRSHMVTEKKYSVESVERLQQQAHSESRESVQEVSCFVRSEIKWVFLKSVKVQTITQRGELER